jgi:hypothetical protein
LAFTLAENPKQSPAPEPAFLTATAECSATPRAECSAVHRLPSVYVYPMPARFNLNLLIATIASADEPWHPHGSMFQHGGFGSRLDAGLYDTFQFGLEYVLHQRLLHSYPRLASTAEEADLLWVPFYPTLSAVAHRKHQTALADNERAALLWLRDHAPRFYSEPHRHIFAIGKTASEHFGAVYGSHWLRFRQLRNVNVLSIEAEPGTQQICAIGPRTRPLVAETLLSQLEDEWRTSMAADPSWAPSSDEIQRGAELVRVLEDPTRVEAMRMQQLCIVRSAPTPRLETSARVWGVPYLGAYAYDGSLRAGSEGSGLEGSRHEGRAGEGAMDEGSTDEGSHQPAAALGGRDGQGDGKAASNRFPWLSTAPRPLLAVFIGAERRETLGIAVTQREQAVDSCHRWAPPAAADGSLGDGLPRVELGLGGGAAPSERGEAGAVPTGSCVVETRTDRPRIRALYSRAVFCLQPPGDTATRSGIFDSILHGCIPVLWNGTALDRQYELHLPSLDEVAIAVPAEHQRDALPWLARVLADEAPRIERIRESIRRVAPRCQYSVRGERPPGVADDEPWDALEHALVGLLRAQVLR